MPADRFPLHALLLGGAIFLSVAACADAPSAPASCNTTVAFTPTEPRLATGDSLVLNASAVGGCGGVSFSWTSSNPAIISVDPATGVAQAHQAGAVQLYVTSGSSPDKIDSVAAVAYAPLFDRIIFTRQPAYVEGSDADRPLELWTMDTSGGDLRRAVSDLHYPEHPRVSPDGKSIVVEDWGTLIITDAGGGARRSLDTGTNRAFAPWWSPDGEWILFVGGSSLNPPWQLHKVRADNSARMQLTSTIFGTYGGDWSPDGTKIIGTRSNAIGLGPFFTEAIVMDANGNFLQLLSGNIPDFQARSPAWAPDGQSILFFDRSWNITKLTLATMQYDTLGDGRGNREGDWSPDGARIVYGTGDLWTMKADGTDERILLSDGYNNFEAAWTPAGP
jgi:Tol biopolymer transport system component